jgi:hypothetical protein
VWPVVVGRVLHHVGGRLAGNMSIVVLLTQAPVVELVGGRHIVAGGTVAPRTHLKK